MSPQGAKSLASLYIKGIEGEAQTTQKVVAALPDDQLEFKLERKGRTARVGVASGVGGCMVCREHRQRQFLDGRRRAASTLQGGGYGRFYREGDAGRVAEGKKHVRRRSGQGSQFLGTSICPRSSICNF